LAIVAMLPPVQSKKSSVGGFRLAWPNQTRRPWLVRLRRTAAVDSPPTESKPTS
jgi:hypothetical protein